MAIVSANSNILCSKIKKINEVLRDFQKQKTHMAIVVDEYGGTSGIVTMEDIMEEILGEILDEFDEEDNNEYEKIDDKTYKFEGKTSLIDFIRIFNENNNFFEDYKGEADSLAGIILESSGEIPEKGYEIKVNNYRFIVDSVTQRRIEKILVKLEDNDEEI
ncbi:MAG: transporter associated domain-containing protein [Saprospiraceae bacterium]